MLAVGARAGAQSAAAAARRAARRASRRSSSRSCCARIARIVRDEGMSAIIVEQNPRAHPADHRRRASCSTAARSCTRRRAPRCSPTPRRSTASSRSAAARHNEFSQGAVMASIVGGIATSHTPTIGFAFDKNKQDDPAWAPIFEDLRADRSVARREAARRAAVHLQRPRHVVLLRPLLGVRAGHRPEYARGRRRRRRARLPPIQGHPALARHIGAVADGRRVRHVVLPGPAARSRLLLAAVDAAAARAGRGRCALVPLQMGVLQFPIPTRAPLLQARARRCGARSRAIPRTCRSRSSPPAACRTRSTASAPASTTRDWDARFLDLFETRSRRARRR